MVWRRLLIVCAVVGAFAAVVAFILLRPRPAPVALAAARPPEVLSDCGDCHMVFLPQLLPQRSWVALLAHLDNHFGDIATLPEGKRAAIAAYLAEHAADGPATTGGQHYLRGVRPDETPLRITDLPWWQEAHGWVNFSGIAGTKVRTASNCQGCHESEASGK